MFRRFNGWFARFMYGRYGSDQLNVVLLVLGLAISLAGSFSRLPWLAYLSWVPFFAVIFRMFSRNISARRRENQRFVGFFMIATRHSDTAVRTGDKLCGTRVIPLVIDEKKLEAAEVAAGGRPILELLPYRLKKAAVITTGSEVFHGRIQDRFTPIVAQKLAAFGITMTEHVTVDDGMAHLLDALAAMRQTDVDLILCTGGMSVDPDDNTPGAIRASGAQIVTYGAPVLPGAMFLLGYYPGGMPVIGLPGCVMYAAATIFDLVLPRIAAGVRLEKQDFTVLGEGGLCLGCKPCHYPACPFGKAGGRV